jgi:hypothetical protein
LSGGGVGCLVVIVIGLIERFAGWQMPKRWYAAVVLSGFFCGANFVAWSSAFQSMKGRELDLHQSQVKEIAEEQKANLLQARLDALSNSAFVEPQNSLRRRAKKLADDIDEYIHSRNSTRPPFGNPSPDAPEEQKNTYAKFTAWQQGTLDGCIKKFAPLWRETTLLLESKGIPTAALSESGNGVNLRWWLNDIPQVGLNCPDGRTTEFLRDLSYRLDAHGDPVHF